LRSSRPRNARRCARTRSSSSASSTRSQRFGAARNLNAVLGSRVGGGEGFLGPSAHIRVAGRWAWPRHRTGAEAREAHDDPHDRALRRLRIAGRGAWRRASCRRVRRLGRSHSMRHWEGPSRRAFLVSVTKLRESLKPKPVRVSRAVTASPRSPSCYRGAPRAAGSRRRTHHGITVGAGTQAVQDTFGSTPDGQRIDPIVS
jgi:hypothetical protein